MATLENLRRQLHSVEGLQSVVKTMKSLAAVNIRQYEKAVLSLEDYYRTVEQGLQIAVRSQETPHLLFQADNPRSLGAIVYGSDQGMCGQFNTQIANRVETSLQEEDLERLRILAIGQRVRDDLSERNFEIDRQLAVPSSTAGITPTIIQILLTLEKWREDEGIDRITLFYNDYTGSTYEPVQQEVLPLDAEWIAQYRERDWPTNQIPTFTMDWNHLFSALVQEYVFASLYRAMAESLASENAARLQAMHSAEKNVEEKMDELEKRYNQQRQSTITAELQDIVAGFEVLGE